MTELPPNSNLPGGGPRDPARPIVAIDGPAGAGKSTVARTLARRLGFLYIDTGAMYRAVALVARRKGIGWDDAAGLARLVGELRLDLVPGDDRTRLLIDGEDAADQIRTAEMSRGASRVSRWPEVREALVAQQRRAGEGGGVVMEGRDIGTVVFPRAKIKIFLTATPDERARRRAEEMEQRGQAVDRNEVLRDVIERDRRDMEREHSPLRRADDAVEVITDGLSIDQVVDRLVALVRERAAP